MCASDKTTGMKSAYELALERLEEQGIEPPRDAGLDPAVRGQIEELRNRTEAKLAELEILFNDQLKATVDPEQRAKTEKEYTAERRRIEDQRDQKIDRLRTG